MNSSGLRFEDIERNRKLIFSMCSRCEHGISSLKRTVNLFFIKLICDLSNPLHLSIRSFSKHFRRLLKKTQPYFFAMHPHTPFFGCHMQRTKSYLNTFRSATQIGANVIQVYSGNPRRLIRVQEELEKSTEKQADLLEAFKANYRSASTEY